MKVYYLSNDVADRLSFHATRKEAEQAARWWREKGEGIDIETVNFEPTRKGVADLLSRFNSAG